MSSDQNFFKKAAISGFSEVAAGQAAAQQSSNQQVKDFPQQMVTDRGNANDELMQLAQQKQVTLPTASNVMHRKAMDLMMKMEGAAFDNAYIKQQVKDHMDAVKLFKKASKFTPFVAIKSANAPTIPADIAMLAIESH